MTNTQESCYHNEMKDQRTLSEELTWRGFVHQYTFENIAALDTEKRTFYWGVDPSAPSMTIGNLAPAMMVRHLIEHGYKAVLLVGGATGMIGDPDGKKQERSLQTVEQIQHNKESIAKQYQQVFAGQSFEIVDNYDWFKDIGYLEFLRDVGKKVPLSQLLDREFIKSRLGEGGDGISYAEFSYNLIQGYDFLHLHREKGVTLQVAGADQWGNSITGVQLIKRIEGAESHVLTAPLIVNKATGVKFGKSESGAVWLDPTLTSPYQFYQFWLNIDDAFAEDLIKIYTMLGQQEVSDIIAEHQNRPQARLLQRRLAEEVTKIVHGEQRLQAVQAILSVLFEDGDTKSLSPEAFEDLCKEIPAAATGSTVVEALTSTGVAESNGAARRLVAGGAVKLAGEKLSDEETTLQTGDLIKVGKNKFIVIR